MVSPCHSSSESDTKRGYIKGMSLPFSCSTSSGSLNFWKNRSPEFSLYLSLCSSDHEAALQFAENTTFVFLCREENKMGSWCRVGIVCNIGAKAKA
jgi:hypothetical protein